MNLEDNTEIIDLSNNSEYSITEIIFLIREKLSQCDYKLSINQAIHYVKCEVLSEKWEEDLPEKKDITRRVITGELRYEIIKKQGWRCNLCGERLKFSENSSWKGKKCHIDHIHPFSKRNTYREGSSKINEIQNLQALCVECNLKKSNKEVN